jgi:quercetin dioxygenase-like cupin family protein
MLKGKVRSQLEDRPAVPNGIGEAWFEPPGTIHLFAANASPGERAQLLAIFIADDDCGALTIFD